MAYSQVHQCFLELPFKRVIFHPRLGSLRRNGVFGTQRRQFSSTHLVQRREDDCVSTPRPSSISPTIYQRRIEDIPFMETHSLTMAMMESSKSGFFKKKVWEKYIERALELKDKLSVKNISIIMISSAQSGVKERNFYDSMAERLLTKCLNYINSYKVDPRRFFEDGTSSEFTGFNIYTILSACAVAGYRNETLLKALFKVSEIKLHHFGKYLNEITKNGGKEVNKAIEWQKGGDKFTFEDLAGILNAYAVFETGIPKVAEKYLEIFKKMYNIAVKDEQNEVGPITPKSFAIAVNSLVKLGNWTEDLYRMGLSYLENNLEKLSVRDSTMVFSSMVKIHFSAVNLEKESEVIKKMTKRMLDRLRDSNRDLESVFNVASSFATVLNGEIFDALEREELKAKFNGIFTEATYEVSAEREPEIGTLVQMVRNSVALSNMEVPMMVLSTHKAKEVGLKGSKRDAVQFLNSLFMIHGSTSSKILKEVIESQITLTVRQFGKRISYLLNPNNMGLAKTRAKPQNLLDLLKLEAKGSLDEESKEINKDWEELTREMSEYTAEDVKALGIVLNSFSKLKQCQDFVKFVNLSCDYIKSFIRSEFNQVEPVRLDLETMGSILHTLSKYRIKRREIISHFSQLIKREVDEKRESKNGESINYKAVFSIVNSYAKLGVPENKVILKNRIRRGGLERENKEERIHKEMFKSISKLLRDSNFEEINLQMATNCMYSLSVVGFDKFSRTTILKLMDKMVEESRTKWLKVDKNDEEDKKEGSYMREYIGEFDEVAENESRGVKDVKSQTEIVRMMLRLLVEKDYFRSRVFRRYLRKIDKITTKNKRGDKEERRKNLSDMKEVEVWKEEIVSGNRMSGLHRSVLTAIKKRFEGIQSEVRWKGGSYWIDVVIKGARRHKFVEIDGPYHYYSQTKEMISSSKMKHFILSNYGGRLIHIPYFEWAKCENEEEKIKYVTYKLN